MSFWFSLYCPYDSSIRLLAESHRSTNKRKATQSDIRWKQTTSTTTIPPWTRCFHLRVALPLPHTEGVHRLELKTRSSPSARWGAFPYHRFPSRSELPFVCRARWEALESSLPMMVRFRSHLIPWSAAGSPSEWGVLWCRYDHHRHQRTVAVFPSYLLL